MLKISASTNACFFKAGSVSDAQQGDTTIMTDSSSTLIADTSGAYRLTVTDQLGQEASASYFFLKGFLSDTIIRFGVRQPQTCNEYGKVTLASEGDFEIRWADGSRELNRDSLAPGSYSFKVYNRACGTSTGYLA